MKVSFRALLVITVCASVWIPIAIVVVFFNARSQQLAERSTRDRLPPTVARLGGNVLMSLQDAESVAQQTALDISSGLLVLDETPQGLHDLRLRWHNTLRAYNSTSSVQFLTSELSEHPGRLIGLAEFSNGMNQWWWSLPNATFEQWWLNISSLDPYYLQFTDPNFPTGYLGKVRSSLPPGYDKCWMPIYSEEGQVWASFIDKSFFPNTTGPSRPVWAYVIVDLIIGDLSKVFSGLTVTNVDGFRTLVSFMRIRRNCLDWVVAVVCEENRVSVDVVPIIVAIFTTIAALVTLGALSVLLTKPLTRLSHKMDDATRLAFHRHQSDLSLFSEFERLNSSFKKLSTGIEAMTKYVPIPVVSQLMATTADSDSQSNLLALSNKRVTIMFCDIRGFTTLSERLPTNNVIQMLFSWLDAFTKIIIKNGGIVDKYIGDCIMALWNVPLDTDRPEVKACTAALEFDSALAMLNKGFQQDANTAARIEQLGKEYGLTPLISGDVANCIADKFVMEQYHRALSVLLGKLDRPEAHVID
eukprot:m51a1_g12499 putative adenylate guanylate cyclase with integral membrane sensor (528) ;mRNA; f:436-2635